MYKKHTNNAYGICTQQKWLLLDDGVFKYTVYISMVFAHQGSLFGDGLFTLANRKGVAPLALGGAVGGVASFEGEASITL